MLRKAVLLSDCDAALFSDLGQKALVLLVIVRPSVRPSCFDPW